MMLPSGCTKMFVWVGVAHGESRPGTNSEAWWLRKTRPSAVKAWLKLHQLLCPRLTVEANFGAVLSLTSKARNCPPLPGQNQGHGLKLEPGVPGSPLTGPIPHQKFIPPTHTTPSGLGQTA